MERVVATAIGRYRRRRDDTPKDEPKTLANSEVHAWSWPCVLVFVDRWLPKDNFRSPEHFIPPYLYLPDGRSVPVCVLQVGKSDVGNPIAETMTFPSEVVGGGFPLVSVVQGRTHVASLGCLVTDGHTTYALTNAHVAGAEGEEISTVFNGELRRLGTSASKRLERSRSVKPTRPGHPSVLS